MPSDSSSPGPPEGDKPLGELMMLREVDLFPPARVQGIRVRLGADWSTLPDVLRNADEWASWRCVDEAGRHWSRVGDAKVLRAAVTEFEGDQPGTLIQWDQAVAVARRIIELARARGDVG